MLSLCLQFLGIVLAHVLCFAALVRLIRWWHRPPRGFRQLQSRLTSAYLEALDQSGLNPARSGKTRTGAQRLPGGVPLMFHSVNYFPGGGDGYCLHCRHLTQDGTIVAWGDPQASREKPMAESITTPSTGQRREMRGEGLTAEERLQAALRSHATFDRLHGLADSLAECGLLVFERTATGGERAVLTQTGQEVLSRLRQARAAESEARELLAGAGLAL